jgi:hypothetical protein
MPEDLAGERVKCPICQACQIAPGRKVPLAEPPKSFRSRSAPVDDSAELTLADIPPGQAVRSKPAKVPVAKPKPVSPTVASPKPVASQAASPKPIETPPLFPPPLSTSPASSPLASLDSFLEDELTAGPTVHVEKPAWITPLEDSASSPAGRGYSSQTKKHGSSNAMMILKIPAAIMMLFSGMGLVWCAIYAFSTGMRYYRIMTADAVPDPQVMPILIGTIIGIIVGTLIAVIVHVIIFRGGLCMIRGRHYSLAKQGAIIAAIPICGFFSFPFGIWALIMLNLDSVKRRFDG